MRSPHVAVRRGCSCATAAAKPVVDPALILLDRPVADKAEVIKVLTDNLEVEQRVISGAEVESAIWQREAIFSTALGFAIALPHCKSAAVSHSSEPDGAAVFDVHYFYGQPTRLESYARTALNPVEYGFEVKLDKAPEASTPQ